MTPPRPGSGRLPLEAAATSLQRILRAMRLRGWVYVRAGKDHLTIETVDAEGARCVVARAIPAEGGSFRLTLLRAPGQWEDHPAAGSLEDLAFGALEVLDPDVEGARSSEAGSKRRARPDRP